ncbi:hypothetical protein [Leptospira alexanderi]|uniref:Uncharacterized protein n=2 Tax=Leptospira alexanderi TaxID=100053 RepID=V6I975_9LEPT|nr:hypothetical protein [Leptospira alexanderi]EQA64044.1 hypothetical protein LEP1GSC062_3784 [Leptospira alexanderi serovar Manhao 3 str. L 60]
MRKNRIQSSVLILPLLVLMNCYSLGADRIFKPGIEIQTKPTIVEVDEKGIVPLKSELWIRLGDSFKKEYEHSWGIFRETANTRINSIVATYEESKLFSAVKFVPNAEEVPNAKSKTFEVKLDYTGNVRTNSLYKLPFLFIALIGYVIIPNYMEADLTLVNEIKRWDNKVNSYTSAAKGRIYFYFDVKAGNKLYAELDKENTKSIISQMKVDYSFLSGK